MTQPIILLIAPQMGENIGAAARAMHNFGLSELRIVSPRDGWPNEKALSMAANAKGIVESARIYSSTAEAIADCHQVIATTARQRGMNKPEMPISCLVPSLRGGEADAATSSNQTQEIALPSPRNDDVKLAIMFGPERTGLENEDITLASALLHIPVSPDNPSLNLGQAVNIVCYEWFMQSQGVRDLGLGIRDGQEASFCERSAAVQPEASEERSERVQEREPLVGAAVSSIAQARRPERGEAKKNHLGGYFAAPKDHTPAPHGELQALFDQLEIRLDAANFWNVPEKKPNMWRNIRTSITRAGLTSQEIQTWHGIFRALDSGCKSDT